MPDHIEDYDLQTTRISYSVLLDIFTCLGEYRNDIVLVGGWVPFLTCDSGDETHCGSLDIDLALDLRAIGKKKYEELESILKRREFRTRKGSDGQPIEFSFERMITSHGKKYPVQLDLLAPEYGGRGKRHRTQKIQNLHARKTHGADLAFEHPIEMVQEGRLPNGAMNKTSIRVVSPVPYLAMKTFAFADRAKGKDAYDIYWIAKYHPWGRANIAQKFSEMKGNKLIGQALPLLREKFSAEDRLGPIAVSEFLQVHDPTNIGIIRRDAYEILNDLIKRI